MGEDTSEHPSRTRLSVPEAAQALNTTVDAIRKRVQRDTISHDKDEDGRVWILLDASMTRQDIGHDTTGQANELVDELRDRVRYLERMLEEERGARTEERLARTEERRRHDTLMAQLMQRIPEIEPPREAPRGSESAAAAPEGREARPAAGGPTAARERPSGATEGAGEAQEHRGFWSRLFGGG